MAANEADNLPGSTPTENGGVSDEAYYENDDANVGESYVLASENPIPVTYGRVCEKHTPKNWKQIWLLFKFGVLYIYSLTPPPFITKPHRLRKEIAVDGHFVVLPRSFPHGGKTKWRLLHFKTYGTKFVRNLLFLNLCQTSTYTPHSSSLHQHYTNSGDIMVPRILHC